MASTLRDGFWIRFCPCGRPGSRKARGQGRRFSAPYPPRVKTVPFSRPSSWGFAGLVMPPAEHRTPTAARPTGGPAKSDPSSWANPPEPFWGPFSAQKVFQATDAAKAASCACGTSPRGRRHGPPSRAETPRPHEEAGLRGHPTQHCPAQRPRGRPPIRAAVRAPRASPRDSAHA